MPDKKCPRCGLWSTGSALRCDCGYDFQKGTIEESYDRKVVPKEIKSFLIFLIVINLIAAIRALANVNTNGGVINLFVVVIWSGLVYWAYSQFVQKKNWDTHFEARKLWSDEGIYHYNRYGLGLGTFICGLIVLGTLLLKYFQ